MSANETSLTSPAMPASGSPTLSHRWRHALAQHAEAVDGTLQAAERVPDDLWRQPLAPGRWSPAQELDHITRAYSMLLSELGNGPGMADIRPRWQQFLLRTLVLPAAIRLSWFAPVPAPPEVEPADDPGPKAEVAARLKHEAEAYTAALLAELAGSSSKQLSHPYFGKLTLLQMLRLATAHTRHHGRRLIPLQSRR